MLARTILAVAAVLASSNAYAQASPHCNAGGVCKVDVDVAPGRPCTDQANITVRPDTVLMGPGGQRMIVWTLPGAYRFCPANGDGIVFKTSELDSQFFGSAPTDDANGADPVGAPGACFKHFRWNNKNEPFTAQRFYQYLVKFTGPAGEACVKDPFIRNG